MIVFEQNQCNVSRNINNIPIFTLSNINLTLLTNAYVICIPVHWSGRSSWSQPGLEILPSSVEATVAKYRMQFPPLIIETKQIKVEDVLQTSEIYISNKFLVHKYVLLGTISELRTGSVVLTITTHRSVCITDYDFSILIVSRRR
jgi:hypothetical protein